MPVSLSTLFRALAPEGASHLFYRRSRLKNKETHRVPHKNLLLEEQFFTIVSTHRRPHGIIQSKRPSFSPRRPVNPNIPKTMKTVFFTLAVVFLVSSAWCADAAYVQSRPTEQPVAGEQPANTDIPAKVNVPSSRPNIQPKTNTREKRASGEARNETQLTKATWFLAKFT